ncbi:MAG: ROK family protein [Comamonadaceae bacterium]|nr:MAG: ROK family protein [Comamonadaceae bacterium]
MPGKKPATSRQPLPNATLPAEAFAPQQEALEHGGTELPLVVVDGYSLKLRGNLGGKKGFIGDTVSRRAFSKILDSWRKLFTEMSGRDPFGKHFSGVETKEISKYQIAELVDKKSAAGHAIRAAIEDYAVQLVYVVRRFLKQPSWHGVDRIVIGGGFQQSEAGARAVKRANELLEKSRLKIRLQRLHHHSDEGGLIGWVHVAPPELLARYEALLAVDIGGTNVRCGIVRTRLKNPHDLSKVDVLGRDKWGHAEDDDTTRREHLLQGIAEMLEKLIRKAEKKGIALAPFVGVACPGTVRRNGLITDGAQNLPGNWESARFHLPRELCKLLPPIDGQPTQVRLHNDAVVQGLSELPFVQDVKHWAVLTVGTGLGNASYTNRGSGKP